MVNENELEILKRYEAEGWKVLRGGAPDFLIIELIFPDVFEKKVRLMLKQIEGMGCLNKRRTSIQILTNQTN